jgi:predicted AlkP superfamily phosphohydrolase/phosphomutase/tetratricopeptide (TPR) repeat protein
MKSRVKSLLIGWDAAEWELVDRYIAAGYMPNLRELLSKGVRGNVATLQPVLSPLLWTSIATGKRPHEHGVLGFVEWQGQKVIPVRGSTRTKKAFWNILEEAGLQTQIINWWPSHPSEQSGKLKVSNQFCEFPKSISDWPLSQGAVYPPVRSQEVADLRIAPQELTQAHLQPFFPNHTIAELKSDPMVLKVASVLARSASIHNVMTRALEDEDWDFSAVYLEALDHFGHIASQYLAPKLEGISEEDFLKYSEIIPAAYRWHDMMLGRLIELAGKNCHIIILSDHGFEVSSNRSINLPDLPAAPALEHRPYGFFAACGPQFKKGESIYGASLLDIAPTILSIYGLPLAEDMPGKSIGDLFKKKLHPSFIPSWELSAPGPSFMKQDDANEQAILQQLDDLGYIDLSGQNQAQKIKEEWEYNRLLSLYDGGDFKNAWQGFEINFKDKQDFRYLNLGAKLLLELKNLASFQNYLSTWPESYLNSPLALYFQASEAMIKGDYFLAQKHLKAIEKSGIISAQVYYEIGRSAYLLGELKMAQDYYQNCLKVNSKYTAALTGLAGVFAEQLRFEESLPLLQESIGLRFFQPQAHYLLALCFKQMEEFEAAIVALNISLKQAPKHRKAQQLLAHLRPQKEEKEIPEKEIIIVTGFPRSGTSMMMGILSKVGFSLLQDGLRVADESNPKGYYELEGIKYLAEAPEDFNAENEQVVKVVAPLLRYLPPENNYRLIWMQRSIIEIIISQEKMKGNSKLENFPYQLAMQMEEEQKRIHQWVDSQVNMNVEHFPYQDFLENTEQAIARLANYLQGDFQWEDANTEIDVTLYRSKIG